MHYWLTALRAARSAIAKLAAIVVLALGMIGHGFAAEGHFRGGLVSGSRILTVTSLQDSGPGSLRAALSASGARLVVFEVAGVIRLETDLIIANGDLTIAGETAPSPGIVIYGGSLRIRASDIVISHISIYAGAASDSKIAEARDSISIYGSPSRKHVISEVLLRNVSVGWGVDENLGIQGLVDGVRIERSLIAHPLVRGGHPKGDHGMNLLLANSVRRISVYGSVLAGADYRSPRLTQGNQVTFVNNIVAASGRAATHIDTSKETLAAGAIDLINNAYLPGPKSQCRIFAIRVGKGFFDVAPPTPVHIAGNIVAGPHAGCYRGTQEMEARLSLQPVTTMGNWTVMPATSLLTSVLPQAGSHPQSRNPLDQAIIRGVESGNLTILQEEPAGGMPDIPERRRAVALPAGGNLSSEGALAATRAWLCRQHQALTSGAAC